MTSEGGPIAGNTTGETAPRPSVPRTRCCSSARSSCPATRRTGPAGAARAQGLPVDAEARRPAHPFMEDVVASYHCAARPADPGRPRAAFFWRPSPISSCPFDVVPDFHRRPRLHRRRRGAPRRLHGGPEEHPARALRARPRHAARRGRRGGTLGLRRHRPLRPSRPGGPTIAPIVPSSSARSLVGGPAAAPGRLPERDEVSNACSGLSGSFTL